MEYTNSATKNITPINCASHNLSDKAAPWLDTGALKLVDPVDSSNRDYTKRFWLATDFRILTQQAIIINPIILGLPLSFSGGNKE